ncbi:MAG: alpha-glucuronidase family glycosyl hydrolase [Planctomycetota bacterium]
MRNLSAANMVAVCLWLTSLLPLDGQEGESRAGSSWDVLEKHNLDIIPAPKQIEVGDGDVTLAADNKAAAVLVLGETEERKCVIGAQEINKTVKQMSNLELPVEKHLPGETAKKQTLILIGTPDGNELVKQYSQSHKISLNKESLGDQGYVIRFVRDEDGRRVVLLAGGDSQGALYACVTFCRLMKVRNGALIAVQANIMDRPDYSRRMLWRITSPAGAKETIDHALRCKTNFIFGPGAAEVEAKFFSKIASTPELARAWKEINQYAQERGVRIVFGGWWALDTAPTQARIGSRDYFYYPVDREDRTMIGHRGLLFCWSHEALINKRREEIRQFIRATGAKAFYLHPVDGGGPDDPEFWSKRCQGCRTKYGDDRAAADAHMINSWYSAMKEEDKDVIFATVVYPYVPRFLERPAGKQWLGRLSGLIPDDVHICLREAPRDQVSLWREVEKQPLLMYQEAYYLHWALRLPFVSQFRYARTFYFPSDDRKDIYWYNVSAIGYEDLIAPQLLGAAEFAWNSDSPGAESFGEESGKWSDVLGPSAPISNRLLPRICRVLYGPEAAAEMQELLTANLSPYLIAMRPPLQSRPGQYLAGVDAEYLQAKMNEAGKMVKLLTQARGRVRPEHRSAFDCQLAHAIAAKYLLDARLRLEKLGETDSPSAQKEYAKIERLLAEGTEELRKQGLDKSHVNFEELSSRLMQGRMPG